jgi:hypothetical protein
MLFLMAVGVSPAVQFFLNAVSELFEYRMAWNDLGIV